MFKRRLLFVITLILILMLTTMNVYAALRTIDTDDTLLDSNWQATPYIADDPEESDSTDPERLPVDMDIRNAWLASDATSVYFRLQMWNGVRAMEMASTLRIAEAELDCNGNGLTTDAVDRVIVYRVHLDSSDGQTNNTIYIYDGQASILLQRNDTYGERPDPSNDDNIEWRVDLADLPPGCVNDIRVLFHTDNNTDENDDSTILGPGFNVPTAVDLHSLSANSGNTLLLASIALVTVLTLVSFVLFVSASKKPKGK